MVGCRGKLKEKNVDSCTNSEGHQITSHLPRMEADTKNKTKSCAQVSSLIHTTRSRWYAQQKQKD